MVGKIKLVFKLFALYGKMDFQWFTQDRLTCLFVMFSDLIASLSGVTSVFLLSERFGGVGALNSQEVLFMLGFFSFSGGVLFLLTGNYNTLEISRRVGRGQVDHMLIQPVPFIVQLMTEGFVPISGICWVLPGLAVVIYTTIALQIAVTPVWILTFILLILARMGIEIGASYLIGAAAFYKPVSCEEISSVALNALTVLGRYPLAGLPDFIVELLVTAFPVGLMAWLPTMLLLGKTDAGPVLLLPVAVAAIALTLAQHYFRKGLRYYAKIGSNRYRSMGFRN